MTRRALAMLALCTGVAAAHPVDEVVQGAYLTLAAGQVQLELDITPGSQVSAPVLADLDANGDRKITQAETRAYAARVLAKSFLKLDGQGARWTVVRVTVPDYANLSLGSGVLKIFASAPRPDTAGTHTLTYLNAYVPAKSQCIANVFLQPGPWTYAVTGQTHGRNNRGLTVTYTVKRA